MYGLYENHHDLLLSNCVKVDEHGHGNQALMFSLVLLVLSTLAFQDLGYCGQFSKALFNMTTLF